MPDSARAHARHSGRTGTARTLSLMSEDDKTPAAEPPAHQPEAPADPAEQPTSQQPAATEAGSWPAPVAPAATVDGSSTVATPAKPRFFDRVVGMRAVAAVALASVLVGGAGGAALGALSNGDDDRNRNGRFGGPMSNFQGPSGMDGNQMPPPGMQGQLPPGLPPSQDDESNS